MASTFKGSVYVSDPETGQAEWFHEGDECPSWAKGLVDQAHFNDEEVDDGLADYPALQQEGRAGGTYDDLKGAELDALLEERDLPKTGTVAEKRARLMADDVSNG